MRLEIPSDRATRSVLLSTGKNQKNPTSSNSGPLIVAEHVAGLLLFVLGDGSFQLWLVGAGASSRSEQRVGVQENRLSLRLVPGWWMQAAPQTDANSKSSSMQKNGQVDQLRWSLGGVVKSRLCSC